METGLLWRGRIAVAEPGVAGVCRVLEEAARRHAAELGVGVEDLRGEGQAWMLVRLGVSVHRQPAPGEAVEAVTWPSRRTAGIRAWRMFELASPAGGLLVEAATVWLVVDLARRRPVRLPGRLLQYEFPERATDVDFTAAPEVAGEAARSVVRTVLPEDLDENGHANNVSFIRWGEEAVGSEAEVRARRLQADYLGEAMPGDCLSIGTWRAIEGRTSVQTILCGTRPLCRLQWW